MLTNALSVIAAAIVADRSGSSKTNKLRISRKINIKTNPEMSVVYSIIKYAGPLRRRGRTITANAMIYLFHTNIYMGSRNIYYLNVLEML